jgi:Phosphotransferase enzyme family
MVSVAVEAGLSGAEVLRHHVVFDSPTTGKRTVSLITKNTTLIERRVLALLQDQHQTAIPFNYSVNLMDTGLAPVCLEDLGSERRPTSLETIPPELLRKEARALAHIHHANSAPVDRLAWLPRIDRHYVRDKISRFWEPAWQRAVEDREFRQEFGNCISTVEDTAVNVADEIARVSENEETLSLIHGDINPSNVLITNGGPRFIDWQTACIGPFYLDLPHHLSTPALAGGYLSARASLGVTIAPTDFSIGFRAAAHYIGLRYIWWTLELWQGDRSQSRWVEYYLDLITL